MLKQERINKRMVSRSLCVVLALLATGALAAVTASSGQASSKAGGTLTVSDWEFTENGVGPHMERVLKTFEKSHPGVTVKFQTMSYDTYAPTIKTQIGAHGGPDIMVNVDSTYAALQAANDLYPITSLTAAEKRALQPANQTAVVKSNRYGLIWETVIYDFLYNKVLLNTAGITKAPTNFSTFLADCKAVKAKTGKWGYAARNMLNETESWYEDFTGTWIYGFGGGWTNAAGKWTIDSPQNIAAVNAFNRVYHSGCMDTGVEASVFRASYENGDVAMLMDNSDAGYTYTYQTKVSNAMQGGGALPFPTKYSGDQQLYLSINKYAKNKPLAEEFFRWLLQPAQQRALIAATAPQTTATKVLPSKGFTKAHAWAKPFYAQVANGKSELVPKRPQITAQLEDMVMPYIARVLSGQLSAKDALQQAQKAANSQFGRS